MALFGPYFFDVALLFGYFLLFVPVLLLLKWFMSFPFTLFPKRKR